SFIRLCRSPSFVTLLCLSSFFFYSSGPHRDLLSFPTRRSSDLAVRVRQKMRCKTRSASRGGSIVPANYFFSITHCSGCWCLRARSEEHTSELQSRFDLVCRLLLEKKKKSSQSLTSPSATIVISS